MKSVSGSSAEVLSVLDDIYGGVVDRIIAKMVMEAAEKNEAELPWTQNLLPQQLVWGCRDGNLLLKFDLECQIYDPPTFAYLFLCIRREESKAVEKKMKLRNSGRVASVASESGEVQDRLVHLETHLHQRSVCASESNLDAT